MTRTIALLPLLLAACSQGIDQPTAASLDGNGHAEMERSLDELTMGVRLKAAETRIVELERKVGALEATPQAIENQLLTQRLEQLEAKVYAGTPDREAAAPARPRATDREPEPTPAPSPAARFNPFGL